VKLFCWQWISLTIAAFNRKSLCMQTESVETKPTILQVLPSLKSGGVERGTVEVARAIAGKGWTSLVASSGGPMTAQLKTIGVEHITLPLSSKNPLTIWRNAQ